MAAYVSTRRDDLARKARRLFLNLKGRRHFMSALKANPSNIRRIDGRILITLVALHALFFIASLFVIPMLAPGARIPNPFASDSAAHDLYVTYGAAVRVSSFLQLVSAVCLAAVSAFWGELQDKKNSSASRSLILCGGLGSAILLSMTALCSWALAAPGGADLGPVLHTLQFLPFLMGGPGWAAFFGLLLLGICLAGTNVLPRWMVWSGLLLALVAELATFVLLTITASVGLPIARFLGFLWLLSAAVSVARHDRREQT